jgi:hypothetical protein
MVLRMVGEKTKTNIFQLTVSSSVGMLYWVHLHTADLGPLIALHLVLVVAVSSLQHGLVNTTSTGNDSHGGTAAILHTDLIAAGQLDACNTLIGVVSNHGGVVTRGTSQLAAITDLALNVADDSTFGHLSNGQSVSHNQSSLVTAVQKLTSVGSLEKENVNNREKKKKRFSLTSGAMNNSLFLRYL